MEGFERGTGGRRGEEVWGGGERGREVGDTWGQCHRHLSGLVPLVETSLVLSSLWLSQPQLSFHIHPPPPFFSPPLSLSLRSLPLAFYSSVCLVQKWIHLS